jgi:coenzyme F420 hydrogenase subunit beta
VRNERGQALVDLLGEELVARPVGTGGKRRGAVAGFIANTARAAGGLPLRAMPDWLRPLMGWLMPKLGPKGLEFARPRQEMKAAETVLHLRRAAPRRMKRMIPDHVWRLVAPYGLTPEPGERDPDQR